MSRAMLVRAEEKGQALIKAKGENDSPVSFAWSDEGTLARVDGDRLPIGADPGQDFSAGSPHPRSHHQLA
ncbi:hypothetical protein [Streptomyces sp. NPDC020362]|uniref:hypothetical protein n=1 Tax=unclassified Streptomyces TaxID=2593676 RepID=UPI0033F20CB3